MAVNRLHMLFHRVEKGWDPVSSSYAEEYALLAEKDCSSLLVDRIEEQVGGLRGKRVLDLGGGPGQYSVLFAMRGAEVTWHDASQSYREIASQRAKATQVDLQ